METRRGSSPAKASPMERMAVDGVSQGWAQAKDNHIVKANLFMEHTAASNPELAAHWGDDWEKIEEQYVTRTDIYEYLSTFLCKVYVIPEKRTGSALIGGAEPSGPQNLHLDSGAYGRY